MGMFDEIICDYPLPGKVPSFIKTGHHFQTKDLDCCLHDYRIAVDGLLFKKENDKEFPINFTGDVEFYTSNWCAFEGEFVFTEDGEDFESVAFKANIVNGKLLKIEQIEYEREPALARSEMLRFVPPPTPPTPPTPKETIEIRGRRMYVQWGSGSGYYVTILETTDRQVCWKTDDGQLEVHGPIYHSLGRTLFYTKEDAESSVQKFSDDWERKKEHYRKLLESKRIVG